MIRYKINGKEVSREEFAKADNPAKFDEMVATGIAPGCMTDDVFLAGLGCNGSQFDGQERVGDEYKQIAKEAGVSVQGKVYMGSLAEYPGDPKAWISSRADAERVCTERGWGCRGAVNVKTPQVAPLPSVGVADDLVEHHAAKRIMEDPGLAERPIEEVKEETKQKLAPSWVKE
jgi:hypothetical protein